MSIPLDVPASEQHLERMAGKWIGLIHSYPTLIYVEMTLAPQGSGLEGTAKYQTIVDHWQDRSLDNDIRAGAAPVTAGFDARTDSFGLAVGRPTVQSQLSLGNALMNAEGVRDPESETLAGKTFQSQSFYVFTRPDKFGALEEKFRKFEEKMPGANRGMTPPGRRLPTVLQRMGSSGGVSRSDLVRWMEPLRTEYPKMDVMQTAHGPLELIVINLFEDRHFSSVFGTRFDELSTSQLTNIWQAGRTSSQNRNELQTVAVADMFSPIVGTPHAAQFTLWVVALRTMRAWREAEFARLAALEATERSFGSIQLISDRLTAVTKGTLWPSELTKNEELVASTRQKIALPALEQKMRALETGATDRSVLAALASWNQNNTALLAYVSDSDRTALQQRAAVRLDAIVDKLMPAELQQVKALGSGMKAVEAGSAWYARFSRDYGMALTRPPCQEVLNAFKERRKKDYAGVAEEMMAALRASYDRVPTDDTADGDRARIQFCNDLSARLGTWFVVPGDNENETAARVHALANELGGSAKSLLPPSMRAQIRFTANTAGGQRRVGTPRERRPVPAGVLEISLEKNLNDEFLPLPVVDAGFDFGTDICWNIFHGRFDEIRRATANQQGFGSKLSAALRNANPQLHYAFVSFIGVASQRYGQNQMGRSTVVFWRTTIIHPDGTREQTNDENNPVHVPVVLVKFYEDSYKIAENAANADGLFGTNLFGYLETVAKLMKNGLLSQTVVRPDGSYSLVGADWEKPILADIMTLFDLWPARSSGVWQFQENLRRYLSEQPSLQVSFGQVRATQKWTELHLAARRDDAAAVARLISRGAKVDEKSGDDLTALHMAALDGSAEAIAILLKSGANINAQDITGCTPLRAAVFYDSTDAIKALLARKASVDLADLRGTTPLQEAAQLGHESAVKLLLDAGANPAHTSINGMNALHYAVAGDKVNIVHTLLSRPGMNVKSTTKTGWTALHFAAQEGSKQCIGELIAKGINVNSKTAEGFTPLHVAAINGLVNVLEPLIIRGADPQAKDAADRTPLDEAIVNNHEPVIRELRKLTLASR